MKYKIYKSTLEGSICLSGAKNSSLKLLTASILTKDKIVLKRYPSGILDAQIHDQMLQKLGKNTIVSEDTIVIEEVSTLNTTLDWSERSIRNTLLILGALTTRYGFGAVPLPGGCKLGERKYDLHVHILEKLGAKIWEDDTYLYAEAPKNGLVGTDIFLPIRSTGATENAIISGTLAQGVTRIWNPHIRPEVLDLVNFINKMGGKIKVFGQEHIEVTGVEGLHGVAHTVIPDNMEAITWVVGTVITKGDVEIVDFPFKDLEVAMIHLRESGVKYFKSENSLIVRGGKCFPIEISTGPHPGINSDVQPILAAFASQAKGKSTIIDLRFPGRYGYAEEMAKMGLEYSVTGNMLSINGKGGGLLGADVNAIDLRAGIALLLTGLTSEGETTINNVWQIERGYNNIISNLESLGVRIMVV